MLAVATLVSASLLAALSTSPPKLPDFAFGFVPAESGGDYFEKPSKGSYVPDVVLVSFQPSMSLVDRFDLLVSSGLDVDPVCQSPYFYRTFIQPDAARKGETPDSIAQALSVHPGVRYAEPDFLYTIDQTLPNDALFGSLYGLHNVGQSGGTVDADIDAPEAWTMTTGSNGVIVAVIDTGVDYNHPDLSANILRDGNGVVIGYDYVNNDANPMDDNKHGTHCAGTIGAVTNNGIGVAGVAHQVKIMPMKFLSASGSGSSSNAILCIDFARQNGAHIMSNSWGGGSRSQALIDAIARARDAGILFVAAAGNSGRNVDTSPSYPASYNRELTNVMSVAATDRNDALASFSNYGLTVDIAAPGVDTMSTVPTAILAAGYQTLSGTSMACPHVAGAAVLVKARFPSADHTGLSMRLRMGAEPKPSLAGKVMTGRMNVSNTLDTDSVPPAPPTGLAMLRRSNTTLKMTVTTTGDDGSTGAATSYDVRVSRNPITEANFAAATIVPASVPSANAGAQVPFGVSGLFPGDSVYVAVKALDNVGNPSAIATAGPYATLPALWMDRVESTPKFTPQAGSAWDIVDTSSSSPTHSWTDTPAGQYGNNADTWLTADDPLTVSGPMALQFFAKYDLESNFDFLHVEVSADGGTNWARLASYTGTSDWRLLSVPLNGYDGQPVRFRFRMTSDGSIVRDGVFIDDIHAIQLIRVHSDDVESGARFAGDAPWAITTESALSPTHAWSDSPGGDHGNGVAINLTGTAPVPVGDIANAQVAFGASLELERNYDYLRVQVARDGGAFTEVGTFTGLSVPWQVYSAPLGLADQVVVRFRMTSDTSVVNDGVYLDDIQIVGEPYEAVGGVSGVIGLDGYLGSLAARPVEIELRGAGGVTESVVLASTGTAGEGAFTVNVAPGTYDLFVRGGTWLQRKLGGVVVPAGGLSGLSLSLVNGNVDASNNAIDIDDFLALASTYEVSPPTNANADLDGDSDVDLDDFLILAANYDAAGDE